MRTLTKSTLLSLFIFLYSKNLTASCTSCTTTNPGTSINTSSDGQVICITSTPSGNVSFNLNNINVTIKICANNVTFNGFDVSRTGFTIENYGTGNTINVNNFNNLMQAKSENGGELSINHGSGSASLSIYVGENSIVNLNQATAKYKDNIIEVEGTGILNSSGSVTIDDDNTIINKGTWNIVSDLAVQGGTISFTNSCGESSLDVGGLMTVSDNTAFINNGTVVADQLILKNSGTISMNQGTTFTVREIEEFLVTNGIIYTGDPGNCATFSNTGPSYNIWNNDMSSDAEINYCGPASTDLGSATASCADCSGSLVTCAPVAPVEFANFTLNQLEKNISLQWITLSESNNSHFEVQRSFNGIDFELIGTVDGKGTTDQVSTYSFYDDKSSENTLYYRIVQYDYDGTRTIGPVKVINLTQELNISVSPHPSSTTQTTIQLYHPDENDINVIITDDMGRQHFKKSYSTDQGITIIDLHEEIELMPRIYIISITSPSGHIHQKLIVR